MSTAISAGLGAAITKAVRATRKGTADRIWDRIGEVAGAPDKLTEPVRISWLDLLRIIEEEGLR